MHSLYQKDFRFTTLIFVTKKVTVIKQPLNWFIKKEKVGRILREVEVKKACVL